MKQEQFSTKIQNVYNIYKLTKKKQKNETHSACGVCEREIFSVEDDN